MSAVLKDNEHTSLYAAGSPVRGLHKLGLAEKRFPLSTARTNPKLGNMWGKAKQLTWDAETDIPYSNFDRSKYSKERGYFAIRRFGRLSTTRLPALSTHRLPMNSARSFRQPLFPRVVSSPCTNSSRCALRRSKSGP